MKDRYYSLDGMRGLAAIVVVLHHCGLQWGDGLAASGYLAVDFFFALSGFVVAHAYQQRLEAGMSLHRFVAIRVVRLYPLFALGLALGLVKQAGQIAMHDMTALSPSQLLMTTGLSAAMLPTPGRELVSVFPLNTPAWSLFFEMVASAAFGLVVYRWRTRSVAGAMVAAAAVLVVGVLTRGGQGLGTNWSDFLYGFPRLFYAFLLGVLMFRLSRSGARRRAIESYAAVPGLVVMLMAVPPHEMEKAYQLGVLFIGIPLLLRAGILWDVAARHERLFAWLGDISYPIYILHFPLLMITLFLTKRLGVPHGVAAVGFLAGMLAFATLALRWFDAPVRRRLSLWLRLPGSCRTRAVPPGAERATL